MSDAEIKLLPRRLSASALKSLDKCSMQFYLSRYLKLPEKVWSKTVIGSIVHLILECLYLPKHRKHHDAIRESNSLNASPAILRLIRRWQIRHKIPESLIVDIEPMVLLVLTKTNFLDEGAEKTFPPESEFKIVLRNGGYIVGFIDRMVKMPGQFVIRDYKTQKDRFTEEETKNSYQSLVYQLYVWKTYGELALVEYLLLRHPPSPLKKNRHIQITPPASPEQLAGFEVYLEHMAEVFNSFTEKDAESRYCEDVPFCEWVCSFRRKFDYMIVKNRDGSNERRFWIDPKINELPYQVQEGEVFEIKSHPGCKKWNSQ